jgi:hypothetical protein
MCVADALVMNRGVSADARDGAGRAALSWARDTDAVRTLLRLGANARAFGSLRGACEAACVEAVEVLLEAGADATEAQPARRHAKEAEGAASLSVGLGAAPYAPLVSAALAECPEARVQDKVKVINLLLDAGARTVGFSGDSTDEGSGGGGGDTTVLHLVAAAPAETHPEAAARVLVERCPELLDARDAAGRTALCVAVDACHPAMVSCLAAAGADVESVDDEGLVVLEHAITYQFPSQKKLFHVSTKKREIVRALLGAGADGSWARELLSGPALKREAPHENAGGRVVGAAAVAAEGSGQAGLDEGSQSESESESEEEEEARVHLLESPSRSQARRQHEAVAAAAHSQAGPPMDVAAATHTGAATASASAHVDAGQASASASARARARGPVEPLPDAVRAVLLADVSAALGVASAAAEGMEKRPHAVVVSGGEEPQAEVELEGAAEKVGAVGVHVSARTHGAGGAPEKRVAEAGDEEKEDEGRHSGRV